MRYVALFSLALFAGCFGAPCRHCSAADPPPPAKITTIYESGPGIILSGKPLTVTLKPVCPVTGTTDCKCGCQDGKPCTCLLVKADAKPTIIDRQQKVVSGRTGLPADGWEKNEPDDGDYGYWKDGVLLSRYCPKDGTYRAFCNGEYGPRVPYFDKYAATPNVPRFPVVNAFFGGGCAGGCCGGRCR